jgi:UPF0755 protein
MSWLRQSYCNPISITTHPPEIEFNGKLEMRRRRKEAPVIVWLFFFGFLCLISFGVVWGFMILPDQAGRDFGSPSVRLGPFERFTYAIRLYVNESNLMTPVDPAGEARSFKIEMGESVNSIALNLENEGLIRDAGVFRLYLIYSGLDVGIQAGEYSLSPALNAVQIAHALQDATPSEITFGVLPGWRLEEIAAALPTSGLDIKPSDFIQAAKDPTEAEIPANVKSIRSLEGFLYPDEYKLKRESTVKDLIAAMVGRFNETITPDLIKAYEREGLNLTQAVTLASIVQREAIVPEEQPLIASVFLNRLQNNMNLDSDPTIQYALGFNNTQNTWWTNPLTADDLQTPSSYNTYLNGGLPPGPICNPDSSVLQAVAYPAKTPYYYFRARCDGSGRHLFAKTYEEQLQNACP